MIKDLYIEIPTKGCRKIKEFEKLGYDINNEFINLKVSDLNIGSRQMVSVECDFCYKIVSITYREYLRNISIGNKYACSKYCGSIKAKYSNLEKWGVEYPMILNNIQDKVKKTNLEKYGVEFLQQCEVIKDRSKKSNLSKWGVDSYSKTEEFLDRVRKTNLEKRGVEFPLQSLEVKEKCKSTWILKYGVDNPTKLKEIRDKAKSTSLEKYGNEIPSKLDIFKNKSKNTNIERYEVSNPMKSDYLRHDKYSITKDKRLIRYVNNGDSLMICEIGHEFIINIDNYIKRIESDIPICTICNPIGDLKSIKEKEIYEFIKSVYDGEIIQSYRDGLEIDIYLPKLNLGFEFNGLYWHSEKYKDKWYHLNKTKYFKEKGIRIIHIWEDDWSDRKDILKSQINNWLGLIKNKIFARKCFVREIKDSKISTKFLEENHIQGKVNSCLKLGLYFGSELVSLMTFDHYEGRKKMTDKEWNINRFCNSLNTNVIGGASKLFKYFINNYIVNRVISYADRDWSQGYLYDKIGFKNIYSSNPDYKYIFKGKRVNKSRFRKSYLGISESKLEMYRIWDCGKIKYEINF